MSKYSSSINNLLHIRQSATDKYIAICNDRDTSIINLDDTNIKAQFRVLDNIWTPSINLNNIESTYNSNVINIGSGNTIIQLNPHIGIGTNEPSVSFEINTVDSMKIPKGNTSQRPTNLTSTDKGFIRYNNELDQFEGFGANDKWRSLESVMDNDQDTYIIAESNLSDNDELQFYTYNNQRMIIKSDGKIGIGTNIPNVSLDISYKKDAIKLPKGDTAARNAIGASSLEDQGLIRYNTELQQFEGYGAGNAWGSLGGVIDTSTIDINTLVGSLNISIYTLYSSDLDPNFQLLAPEASATLILDTDYSIVGAEGTEQYDTFIVDMTYDLADILGVDESSIEITEVSEGSLVVDFVLKPSEIDNTFNPSQAVVALKENLENPDIAQNNNSKFLKQATVAVPPEVVAQASVPSKIFVTLENDRAKIINIAKYFKGEFITYELVTNPHNNILIDSALQQITITGAFRDSIYDIVINATKGSISKDLIFNVTEPAPFPPTAKDPKNLVLSDNKKQVNLLDKFKGSYLEIFEIDQNPFNNVSLVDSSNMIYEVQGAFRDTSYSIVFKATQNGGDNLSAYWTLNIKELPLIPTKLLPDIDNLLVATGQTITYNLEYVFIGNGLEYGFRTNPYPDNIYISNNLLYITENQRGITYPIEIFGKNLAQTLIWKITLTEDLPPAPTVIGVDSSNFITTDIINYDLTTIFSGINVTYDIEYYYNIGGSIYPPIDSFFIQNKPWARYHSKNWNKYLNRIVDTSGNNRESIELLSGNISIGSNYISGDKDASMKIPMPNTFNWTVCFAVKYNGANKGTIISGEQTILGHWNGYRGFVQLGGKLLTKIENIGNADDWLILCIKTNGTAPNNIRLNGTSIGVQTNEVALDYLYINKDLNSDWIFGDFMIWDYEFNTSQTLTVSDLFLNHIAGTTNALNNDIQPVELKSIYNNYNFENNIVSISGNNRGTKYDIYVLCINTSDSVKWKLEIGEGAGTRSENISLTKGVHEYNIKHLFNSTDYEPHLTINNENFYNINGNVLTFYPNYRDLEYGLIINSANEQYIFNIKEETGVAPRSFSDNNFYLIDNRVIENVDVIGANAIVDNTIVIESTTVLYFPENMVSSLLLIDNNKYYYINNIVLNGIYQIECDSNDIKVLDNTLNVKYSSLSNGIAVDNTVVNNLLTDVFSVTDASSNPKFVLKYTPYEKVTILNNFVSLVSTVDVNPEFSSGSTSIISGSTYSYSSDNNFTANFTEQFDNCELLLIDNNKYYYNPNVSLVGNKQFILSSSNVELVGSIFNSGTDGEVIDLTNVNDLITNVFGSDQIISGSSGSSGTIDTTNMLVWYKFNDATNIGLDSSGNNNDGTNAGSSVSTSEYKRGTGSLALTNTSYQLPSIQFASETTISFWLYGDWSSTEASTADHNKILNFFNFNSSNVVNYRLSLQKYTTDNKFHIKLKAGSLGSVTISTDTILNNNTWYSVILTFNTTNGNIKIYINNNLIKEETHNNFITSDISYTANNISGNNNSEHLFYGYIDDFRIYNKALTAQEISDIYNDTEPLVGGSSSSATTGTIDTTNMLVWYKFDDDLIDTIGNTNVVNGDINNLENITPRKNTEKYLNLASQVSISSSLQLGSYDAFTVSLWVYMTSTSYHKPLLYFLEDGSHYQNKNFFGFYISFNSQILKFDWQYNGIYEQNVTNINLSLDTWVNIVLIYSKIDSNIKLYLDNILVDTNIKTNWIGNVIYSDILLGNWPHDFPTVTNFPGYIDDFRIYNKALTAQEISDIYNDTEPLVGGSSSSTTVSSVNTAKNNLVIWYNFENNLDDSSGNNHNATNPGNGISFNTDSKVDNYSLQQSGYTNADKNYVQIPNTFDLYNSWNGNGISISMWFKIDPVTDSSKSWGNTLIQFSEFETDVWPMNRITLAQNGIENKFWLGIHDPLLGDAVRYNTKNVLDGKIDSQWHHIVLSISSTGVWTLNCDTIDQGEIFTNLIPDVRYVKNTIGTSLFGTDRGTTGLVDDFRIYNKVLTSAEITAIYNNDVTQSVISSTNYTPIQRVFLKYTTIVKTIEPSIVDTIYLHPVNTTPVLIANDEYYVEIKSTNIIYLPKTYENAEILIIGSTKYVKYENVSLNEFAIITINNDQTTISVNNNNYDLTNGTTIDTALTTELNTYNITEHNNVSKVLIKYTTIATTKITNVIFKDQEYLNVLDYATSLQITNTNITYNENNLKISSNVINDFDNYFTETIQATNEYGTSSLDYNFIKLGYDGVVVPNLENVSKDIYISNTTANIDLREIANGDSYKLIFNPYEFQNNTVLIGDTLTLTTNARGIYDILVSIDNKLYVLRIHEIEDNMDDSSYTIG